MGQCWLLKGFVRYCVYFYVHYSSKKHGWVKHSSLILLGVELSHLPLNQMENNSVETQWELRVHSTMQELTL